MRGRKLKVVWQEDAATLKQLFLSETDTQIRPRLHLLWLVCKTGSLHDAADVLAIAYDTAQRWLRWYRQGGLAEVRLHRKGGGPGRACLLTPDQRQTLLTRINQGEFHTAAQIKAELAQSYQLHYRRSGVYTLLRRLKVKKKVPRPHATKADDQAQLAWKKGG